MPDAVSVANALATQGLPTLLLDTCSMIDVARGPTRLDRSQLENARLILEAATAAVPRCALVRASPIRAEYARNVASGERDLRTYLEAASSSLAVLEPLERWLDPAFAGYVMPSVGLVAHLRSLADGMESACLELDQSVAALPRVMHRVTHKILPARQGKDSTSDCLILEEYLELGALLTSACPFPLVMLSSNATDFHHPSIDVELNAAGIKPAKNWNHARHLLGL